MFAIRGPIEKARGLLDTQCERKKRSFTWSAQKEVINDWSELVDEKRNHKSVIENGSEERSERKIEFFLLAVFAASLKEWIGYTPNKSSKDET